MSILYTHLNGKTTRFNDILLADSIDIVLLFESICIVLL